MGYKDFKKLVIGCGIQRHEDAWNIDILKDSKADQVLNMLDGLPFDDESFSEIVADYVLCQVHDNDKFIFAMNEIWRVLGKDGVLKLKVPNAKFPRAFTDPMDSRYFTPETFDYFNFEHYRYKAFHYGFKPWRILRIEPIHGGIVMINDRLYVEMQKYEDSLI